MEIKDDIARRKLEEVREAIREGRDSTKPWLGLDVDAFRVYRNHESDRSLGGTNSQSMFLRSKKASILV